MSRGPELPSVSQLLEIAEDFGIDMTAERAGEYRDAMTGGIRALRRIDDLVEERPEVKYPRTPGRRPRAEENPYNAWYWLTDIKGAESGPLAGMRIGVKDTVSVAGVPMMNGSRVLEGYMPQIDATIVTRLLDAGAVIAGKTASSDFSFSAGGHTSAYGPVRNPHKPSHAPGGSSKGSGAALAAGDIELAIGGDQGGSIRIPAAWCGVVGHKPTYGLVPYTGCMGIELSHDVVGPMANSVENAARLLGVLAGPDPFDPRQRGVNVPYCYTNAMALYSMKCLTAPSLPNNEGSTKPISVRAPKGCILNAQPPSPTGGRHIIGHFVSPLIFGALAEAASARRASARVKGFLPISGTGMSPGKAPGATMA